MSGGGVAVVGDLQLYAALESRLVGDDAGQGVARGDPGVDRWDGLIRDGADEVVSEEVVRALVTVVQAGELLRQSTLVVDRSEAGQEGVTQCRVDIHHRRV